MKTTDLTRGDVVGIAAEQSAIDSSCAAGDFFREEHVVVLSRRHDSARKYLSLPFALDLVSYGRNVVASARKDLMPAAEDYLRGRRTEACFETPALHELDSLLAPYGLRTCHQAEYFLPDPEKTELFPCPYVLRILEKPDFSALYLPEWSNALCAARRENDVLCVGAYDGGTLIGLAGCSADCDTMWQIGIDVLPAYRQKGIAAALVSRLARETFLRGKIPFYCAAWSNIPSKKTAVRCGFFPAWVQLTAKAIE